MVMWRTVRLVAAPVKPWQRRAGSDRDFRPLYLYRVDPWLRAAVIMETDGDAHLFIIAVTVAAEPDRIAAASRRRGAAGDSHDSRRPLHDVPAGPLAPDIFPAAGVVMVPPPPWN